MPPLTATRTLLHRTITTERAASFSTQDNGRRHTLNVDRLVWDDLGQPDIITVTIAPGDQLSA